MTTLKTHRNFLPGLRLTLSMAVCLGLLSSFRVATAAEAQSSTNAPLRVGVSPIFPPMIFKQGKTLAGVEVDMARALGEQLNRPIVFVEIPWDDQIEALKNGKTDIIMSSMSMTTPRRYVINFSDPYLLVGQVALVRRVDLNKYVFGFPPILPGTTGVLKGTTGDFLVQREFPKSKRKTFTSATEAAEALKKKRIDLFISDSTLVWYLAGTYATEDLAAVQVVLSEEPLAWGLRKGDDALLASVNSFVKKARADGTFDRAFKRWTAVGP